MSILARDPVTGALTLIDSALPRDVALDLGAGAYEVLPVGDVIGSVNVLDVAFATAPLVSGSATAGATLTVSGTATSAVAYEYQWLADGVLISGATSNTYATDATADLGKTFTGQMRAQDARGRWTAYAASSNSITIPAATYTIPDDEWTAVEDPDDAETRQTYVTADPTVPVPAGKKLRWYKGPTNPTDSSMFVFLSDMAGTGPYTADGVSTVAVGTVVYSRLAISNLDNTGQEWVTSIKNYTTSNVPAAPGAFTATNSTTVTGRVSLDPNNTAPAANGRPIIEYGYSQNGGAITAFATGGTATTARDVDFVGIDPIAVRLHARNVNGWSAGSAPQTVTPPLITAATNTTAPYIDSNFYGQGGFEVDIGVWTGSTASFVIDIEKSDDGTTGWTTHAADVPQGSGYWPQTTLDTKYVRAKVTPAAGSAAYSAVYQMKDSPTHVIYFTQDVINYAVSTPLFGAELTTGGIWFSFMYYYASGTDVAEGSHFTFNNLANGLDFLTMDGLESIVKINGITLTSPAQNLGGAPADPQGQWYMMTVYWYKVGSLHYIKGWRNAVSAVSNGVSNAFTLGAGGLAWDSIRIGGPLNTVNFQVSKALKMCGFMAGKGNPEQFHIDTYNDGKFRNPLDYDFASDPNGCTNHFAVPGYRVGAASYAASQMIDTIGSITPTAARDAPEWSALLPPFIAPTGGAVPVQGANIRPLYAPAGTPQTFEYGYGKMVKNGLAAAPWVTATSYVLDQRATQGGNTYICVLAHTSGTFATDLTAEKWAIFTINSLSHVGYAAGSLEASAGTTSLGNILPSVTNGIFTCTTPGTITASVTCGKVVSTPAAWAASTAYTIGNRRRTGTPEVWWECTVAHTSAAAFNTDLVAGYWKFVYGTYTIVSKLYEPQTMPATPRNGADYGGNGLVCGFDPYPTPAAAGTTFASVAALATGIGAVGAGGYLCVNNLTDTGTDLTIPPGDYGGAVVEAKNLHGVNVKDVVLHDVRNLTLRGFKGARFKSGGNDFVTSGVRTGCDGVWIDHCYGTMFDLTAKVYGTSRVKVRNWQTPDNATASYHLLRYFSEALFFKGAIGESTSTDLKDRLVIYYVDRLIADRIYVGPFGGLLPSDFHADLIQSYPSGLGGYFGGYFINSVAIDKVDPLKLPTNGALYFDYTIRVKDFWCKNFIGRQNLTQTITIAAAVSNVSIENCFGKGLVGITTPSLSFSGYADNNVRGSSGEVVTVAGGTNINTTSLGTLGISYTTVYPQYDTYPLTWRALANPAAGYTESGPATFIAELEAKRVALGI